MLEECVDYLELAARSLNQKISMLEEEENSLLFQTTDNSSFHEDQYQTRRYILQTTDTGQHYCHHTRTTHW